MAPQFVRPCVRDMQGYEPGEQPAVGERVVKLNTNENPYPPSERVMQAIADLSAETLRRYPNPTADTFRDAAAKLHGVTRQHIIAGNGSDDLLTIATRCFVPPGAVLAFPDPTYSLYPVLARLQDAKALPLPWGRDWNLPVDALAASGAHAIYLANPNAPSGTFVSPLKVAELAGSFSGLLLVDEAYVDFADDNCVALVQQFANLVISAHAEQGLFPGRPALRLRHRPAGGHCANDESEGQLQLRCPLDHRRHGGDRGPGLCPRHVGEHQIRAHAHQR